MFGKSAI